MYVHVHYPEIPAHASDRYGRMYFEQRRRGRDQSMIERTTPLGLELLASHLVKLMADPRCAPVMLHAMSEIQLSKSAFWATPKYAWTFR